jgi:hypothetical protein
LDRSLCALREPLGDDLSRTHQPSRLKRCRCGPQSGWSRTAERPRPQVPPGDLFARRAPGKLIGASLAGLARRELERGGEGRHTDPPDLRPACAANPHDRADSATSMVKGGDRRRTAAHSARPFDEVPSSTGGGSLHRQSEKRTLTPEGHFR